MTYANTNTNTRKYAATEAGMKAYGMEQEEITVAIGELEGADTDAAEMNKALHEFSQQTD